MDKVKPGIEWGCRGKVDNCKRMSELRPTIGVILGLYGISKKSLFTGIGSSPPSPPSSSTPRSYGIVSIEDTVVYTIRSSLVMGAKEGMAPTIIRMRGLVWSDGEVGTRRDSTWSGWVRWTRFGMCGRAARTIRVNCGTIIIM